MWSVWQTCRTGRRAAGFLGGLLVALLLAAGPAAGEPLPNQLTLSNGLGDATTPVVAAGAGVSGSGQVQVSFAFAWKEGNDIWFKRASASQGSCGRPGSLEFGNAERLSSFNSTLSSISRPAIAANGRGGVFVAWVEVPSLGPQYIRLWRSLEGGTPSLQSLDFNGTNPNIPAVDADDSRGVFIAAEGSAAGLDGVLRTSVLVAQSTDDGANFTYVNVTANRTVFARRPSVVSDGSEVHVVWRETGVLYKGFTRGSSQATVDGLAATPLTANGVAVAFPPKIALSGGEVTAAWFEGTTLKAVRTTGGVFPAPGSAGTIHSSSMRLSNLSLSGGPAGRLFGWQEATGTSTSENRYLLEGAPARTYESGSSFESVAGASMPTAGPSVAHDGTGRVVASWRENGTTSTQIMRGYAGGSGGGEAPALEVRHAPQTLNAKTDQGNGVFNFWISGVQGDIYLNSVKVNDRLIPPIRSAVDANGDLHLTFSRSALKAAFVGNDLTATQRNGSYTITASTSTGCFQATKDPGVHILW